MAILSRLYGLNRLTDAGVITKGSLAAMPSVLPSVLFVCLGNICRSPLAEGALRGLAAARAIDIHIDSAGTGDWNLGKAPDDRAQAVAQRHGIDISACRARLVTADDFARFDHIIALDAQNLSDLRAMQPARSTARLSLLLDHVPGRAGQAVNDPYYGDAAGFDETWADVAAGAHGLITLITPK
jgi:protein-tyrosine phosphatase